MAVSTQMLNAYLKDVIGSFLYFFVIIGPVIYISYFKKISAKKDVVPEMDEDKYTKMLK
jgi:hypothetical protein